MQTIADQARLPAHKEAPDFASPLGELAIYGCGGTGINNTRAFEAMRGNDQLGVARILPYYLDTSLSNNFAEGGMAIPAKSCVIYEQAANPMGADEDVDGSGGIRAVNHDLIKNSTPSKVRDIMPSYAAAIVTSAGGGSGSLIAPYLLKEILAKTEIVVVFVIGDRSTDERAKNTINTINSLEGIARSCGKDVPIAYFENTAEMTRSQVNIKVQQQLSLFSVLVSRRNAELDTMDLRNFLQVHKILKDEPHICRFEIRTGVVEQNDLSETTATSATLTVDSDISGLNAVVRHGCMGVLPPNIEANFQSMKHIHFFVDPSGMDPILSSLNASKKARAGAVPVRRNVDILAGASANDDGVCV